MLNENITKYRKLKGYTQKQLADKVGISGAFMSLIEKGTNNPSDDNLKKIANALDVSTDDLLREEPNDPIVMLISNLIQATEKEKITWKVDDDFGTSYICQFQEVTYMFSTYKVELVAFWDNYEQIIATEKEYPIELKKLYETINMFVNDNSFIFEQIRKLKDLLEDD